MLSKNTAAVPLAPGAVITENAQPIQLGEGTWKTADRMYTTASSTQYVMDPETSQVAYMGVLKDGDQPAMYTVRLKVDSGRISQIETLVAHASDGPFIPEGYIWREAPYIRLIPDAKRNTRQELIDTADTYWKTVTTTHDGASIPYSVDCWHFENGMNTDWERPLDPVERAHPADNAPQAYDGRIWTCAREVGLTSANWTSYRNLHQLVDPERGLVMSWVLIDRRSPQQKQMPRPKPEPGFYGPPTRGPDGWPMNRAAAKPGAKPAAAPRMAIQAGPQYQVSLMRIVGGQITREQVFERPAPAGVQLPF